MAPPSFSSPSPRLKGPWGGGRKILAPMGNELRKSYQKFAHSASCVGSPFGYSDGVCVDFSPAATYMIAMNDFMASGGDGYPVLISRAYTRELMDQVLEAYIQANSPVAPAIQGRIICTGTGCPTVMP